MKLCVIVGICFTLYQVKSGVEYRTYNDRIAAYGAEHTGFVEREETPEELQSLYQNLWTNDVQSICVQAFRGVTEIRCVIRGYRGGDSVTMYDYASLDHYGISYCYEAFE